MPARGDHDADPVMAKIAAVRPIRPAAVLVPIVDHPEPTVLLTQRAQHLPDHAGQVSFPGGKIDAGDATPLASALREADEEIGLAGDFVEPLGYLDLYLTTLGYRIVPVIARVKPGFVARAQQQRGGRDVRGAARLCDGPEQRAAPFARLAGHDPALLRDHLRRALHLGRDRWNPAQSARTDLSMIRIGFTEIVLFLAPFVLYAVFLWATKAGVMHPDSWPVSRIAWLAIAALLLVVGSFIFFAQFSGAPAGATYVPAHMENGKFVPGRVK